MIRMNLEQFKLYINSLREDYRHIKAIESLDIDADALLDSYKESLSLIQECVFGKGQSNIINWWLYDAPGMIVQEKKWSSQVVPDGSLIPKDLADEEALYNFISELAINAEYKANRMLPPIYLRKENRLTVPIQFVRILKLKQGQSFRPELKGNQIIFTLQPGVTDLDL